MKDFNWNELTLEQIGQWPRAFQLGFIFVVSLGLGVLGYWFFIKANVGQYQTLKIQEQVLKASFEVKQSQISSLPQLHQQIQLINKSFDEMLTLLPAQNEMPGLLEDISKQGLSLGLNFELFAPDPEIIHDFYIELPIKITVVGTYRQLAIFVSNIAQLNRLVTLHAFSIKPAASKDGKDEVLVMNITAKIYRYRLT